MTLDCILSQFLIQYLRGPRSHRPLHWGHLPEGALFPQKHCFRRQSSVQLGAYDATGVRVGRVILVIISNNLVQVIDIPGIDSRGPHIWVAGQRVSGPWGLKCASRGPRQLAWKIFYQAVLIQITVVLRRVSLLQVRMNVIWRARILRWVIELLLAIGLWFLGFEQLHEVVLDVWVGVHGLIEIVELLLAILENHHRVPRIILILLPSLAHLRSVSLITSLQVCLCLLADHYVILSHLLRYDRCHFLASLRLFLLHRVTASRHSCVNNFRLLAV